MVFFTSDLHFGHANIIKHCNRPFSSVEEMDRTLIENWNARVSEGDNIYILGDLMFKNTNPPEYYLKRLKGRKHLIIGNHDLSWINDELLKKYFVSVDNLLYMTTGKVQCTLCHYPMLLWPHHKKCYMVFGHIHNDTKTDCWDYIAKSEVMFNAGVDVNNYFPVTFDEMVANNIEFKKKALNSENNEEI